MNKHIFCQKRTDKDWLPAIAVRERVRRDLIRKRWQSCSTWPVNYLEAEKYSFSSKTISLVAQLVDCMIFSTASETIKRRRRWLIVNANNCENIARNSCNKLSQLAIKHFECFPLSSRDRKLLSHYNIEKYWKTNLNRFSNKFFSAVRSTFDVCYSLFDLIYRSLRKVYREKCFYH